MTDERIQEISEILAGDAEFAKEVLAMSPEDACKALEGKGLAITVEEVTEYGQGLREYVNTLGEELAESELENVSGGSKKSFAYGAVAGAVVTGLAYAGVVALVTW